MGLHSNTTENDTSPSPDVSMLSTIVEEKLDVNSCPSSMTCSVSPNQASNGVMDVSYDVESSENMKNGNCAVAIVEADSNTGHLKEITKGNDDSKEETEFPHEPGIVILISPLLRALTTYPM
ncbi:unnamed protein product [Rodentolepis nana]|uniref:Ovule protein n=1 Tax=Rodentolepis nana TaxID=102285 RepID=A0A0R3T2C9_RODNA|nr:unnamed protein product [Rodentolepis nana]